MKKASKGTPFHQKINSIQINPPIRIMTSMIPNFLPTVKMSKSSSPLIHMMDNRCNKTENIPRLKLKIKGSKT